MAQLSGLSRAEAKALVLAGAVTVKGKVGRPTDAPQAGDAIEIRLPEPSIQLEAEPVPFEVRFEDSHVAVVDKPSGVVSHPGAGTSHGTLASGILHRWPQVFGIGDPDRWGLIHRLDRETSGLLLVALTPLAMERMRRDLAAREITRTYDALAHGHFEARTGTIDAPIGRDATRPTRMAVDAHGKPARTHYRVEEAFSNPSVSRLSVTLETGRTHQIRVHLASISHPLVGDAVYGPPRQPDPGRVWLHSRSIVFRHPESQEWIDVSSPLPDELESSLAELHAQT